MTSYSLHGAPDAGADFFEVGLGEREITPDLKRHTVWLAGFGSGRRAEGVHDPLYARAVVLRYGKRKLALISIDVIGLFYQEVKAVRAQLADYEYVLISSTHNHEGPDTLGLWGPNLATTGVDLGYMDYLRQGIIRAVREAEKQLRPAHARYGIVRAPELLQDSRLPIVKHDELVVLEFISRDGQQRRLGLLVQWNCHPETLGSKNKLISADFVGVTVRALVEKYKCRVAYFTGTVGGLLSSLGLPIRDEQGRLLADGTWEKTERYGILVARKVEEALQGAKAVRLVPWRIRRQVVYLPVANRYYRAAAQLKVVVRETFLWTGNPYQRREAPPDAKLDDLAIETELGLLELGELKIVAIPGEIYPELVVGGVQDPVDPGADYPEAPIEPIVYEEVKGPVRMLIGLANDEIGYIIPKRQWDERPPFCYGRKQAQYGEINSLGPETAPILLEALRRLAREHKDVKLR
ncbi:MAG: neutral/alkaline non-lysosomal ceramidase N-terminal domain-containing protein [Gemmatales bacterium]|nr:neutral/alkaline non-lysosomal ceramidase N-terminal domain-containing protein [Gemmatales bacterium]MDW7995947.1 neutral/alkaline non-lysosomal ceramidase N-terminal domain-containing protein [Gemmatales bacterium]